MAIIVGSPRERRLAILEMSASTEDGQTYFLELPQHTSLDGKHRLLAAEVFVG
jgi:hypothetical protein